MAIAAMSASQADNETPGACSRKEDSHIRKVSSAPVSHPVDTRRINRVTECIWLSVPQFCNLCNSAIRHVCAERHASGVTGRVRKAERKSETAGSTCVCSQYHQAQRGHRQLGIGTCGAMQYIDPVSVSVTNMQST